MSVMSRPVKMSPDGYPLTKQGVRDLGKTKIEVGTPELPPLTDGARDYDLSPPFSLMVSENCGCSYYCAARRDDPSDFDSMVAMYEGLRWYVEDSKGKFVELCPIHQKILAIMSTMH